MTKNNLNDTSLSRISTTTSRTAPVHPIELVAQSMLESPLDLLSLSLHSLYESQMILSTILNDLKMELSQCMENIGSGTETDNCANRIHELRLKMESITHKLDLIDERVSRIETKRLQH